MNSKLSLLLAAATLSVASTTQASLIIHESFNYTLNDTAADPDGGLNGGSGLPATNVGGNPSGTSTGLRGSWSGKTNVVAGLTYSNAGGTLSTSGNALNVTATGFGAQTYVYRFMGTDPFLGQRVAGLNNGLFGVAGTSLYFSVLAQTSSATAGSFGLSLKTYGSDNQYFQNTATGWQFNNSASVGTLELNTPTLLVVRIDFAAGATDSMSFWVNPTLGQPLGIANTVVTGQNFDGLGSIQVNSTVAGAMTFDEFRMGTSALDVLPSAIPEPSSFAALAGLSALGLVGLRRRRRA